jgi:hypothetical protein
LGQVRQARQAIQSSLAAQTNIRLVEPSHLLFLPGSHQFLPWLSVRVRLALTLFKAVQVVRCDT